MLKFFLKKKLKNIVETSKPEILNRMDTIDRVILGI